MKFTLEIDCDNAAFEDEEGVDEVRRILRNLADRVYWDAEDDERTEVSIFDSNGNRVGYARFQ